MITLDQLSRSLGISLETIYNLTNDVPEMIYNIDGEQYMTTENADLLREQVESHREQNTEFMWIEDGPTLDSNHAYTYGEHGLCDGVPVVRIVWNINDPVDGPAGRWSVCYDCDPHTGMLIVEDDKK